LRQGKHTDAERIDREVLGARRRVLGEEHPDTLGCRAASGTPSLHWNRSEVRCVKAPRCITASLHYPSPQQQHPAKRTKARFPPEHASASIAMSRRERPPRQAAPYKYKHLGHRSSQIGLAFLTHPTALPQAFTLIGAAAMPEIMPDRQHTMHAVPICACASASDVRKGALFGRGAGFVNFVLCFQQDPGHRRESDRVDTPGFFLGGCHPARTYVYLRRVPWPLRMSLHSLNKARGRKECIHRESGLIRSLRVHGPRVANTRPRQSGS
jgi:hypothetical protein